MSTAIPTSCKACGKPIVQPGGRHRKQLYCNPACKMKAHRREKPEESAWKRIALQAACIAELESQVKTLEERLQRIKEVEVLYLTDSKPRHFKTWLRKQSGSKAPFAERFLQSPDMPPMASRKYYESRMLASEYTHEDIETFREFWRVMLVSEV